MNGDRGLRDKWAKGAFIAIVGPDGVGKTRLASELLRHWPGPSMYIHFAPPLFRDAPNHPPKARGPSPAKAPRQGSRLLGWVRLLRNLIRFWLGYAIRVRPMISRGGLVIADRWLFGYIGQPYGLRYYGPDGLARLATSLAPKPHLVANLVAPPEVIWSRKQDLSIRDIEEEIVRWSTLNVGPVLEFDATKPPRELAADVTAFLRSCGGGQS